LLISSWLLEIKKDILLKIGNFSEFLPICDDYELLIRSSVNMKMVRMNKLGYIQYMNTGNSNFSLMWNAEISRLGPQYIKPHCYGAYKVEEKMKGLNASENTNYAITISQIWKRGPGYEYKFCNKLVNLNYTKEYCILGVNALMKHLSTIRDLYTNPKNDFIVLDYNGITSELCKLLDGLNLDRMKCYVMNDCGANELLRYFLFLYRTCDDYQIIE
jgi:hypothetical protein